MRTEPAVIIGTLTALAAALLAVLISFGIPVSDDQQAAILALIAILAPLVAAVITRTKVYAPATMNRAKAIAYGAGVHSVTSTDRTPGPDHRA